MIGNLGYRPYVIPTATRRDVVPAPLLDAEGTCIRTCFTHYTALVHRRSLLFSLCCVFQPCRCEISFSCFFALLLCFASPGRKMENETRMYTWVCLQNVFGLQKRKWARSLAKIAPPDPQTRRPGESGLDWTARGRVSAAGDGWYGETRGGAVSGNHYREKVAPKAVWLKIRVTEDVSLSLSLPRSSTFPPPLQHVCSLS